MNLVKVCNLQCLCGHINEFVRRYTRNTLEKIIYEVLSTGPVQTRSKIEVGKTA